VTRFALQPRWLAWHVLLVVVLVSFGWLGRWQLSSFERKGTAVPQDHAAVALDRLSHPGGRLDAGDVGRRVVAHGRYDGAQTLLVPARVQPRTEAGPTGFLVVTPLRTRAGVLPVLRGWVPTPRSPAAAAPTGPIRVVGVLQRSEAGPPPGAPATVPAGQLSYVATVTLIDTLPLNPSRLYDGYLALRTEQPSPTAGPVPPEFEIAVGGGGVARWRNLAYALQWWLFAAAAVFFWWTVLRRAALEQREQERGREGDGAGPPSLVAPPRTT
jgi:cytochrome oxidase assembly protein ShyY1